MYPGLNSKISYFLCNYVIMYTFNLNKRMRLKACEQKRLYYHTHEQYCMKKNKNGNERNKKQCREDSKYLNELSHLFCLLKKIGETSGNISSFISINIWLVLAFQRKLGD